MNRRQGVAGHSAILLMAAWAVAMAAAGLARGEADPLDPAARAVEGGDLTGAIVTLRALFDAGYPTPADVLADPRFAPLREDGDARAAWRGVMKDHAREARITMVTPRESGTPMIIRGRVVRAPDGAPIAGALIEMNHTDATGHYEPGRTAGGDGRARLFGFIRTGDDGRFEARTIKPAPYPGASEGAAHIHYRASAAGYRSYSHDFRPYDHPRDPAERATALERAQRFTVARTEGDTLICEVTIPMLPAPAGE